MTGITLLIAAGFYVVLAIILHKLYTETVRNESCQSRIEYRCNEKQKDRIRTLQNAYTKRFSNNGMEIFIFSIVTVIAATIFSVVDDGGEWWAWLVLVPPVFLFDSLYLKGKTSVLTEETAYHTVWLEERIDMLEECLMKYSCIDARGNCDDIVSGLLEAREFVNKKRKEELL